MSSTIVTDASLDTNILFYAFDATAPVKHRTANRVLAYCYHRQATVALQVFNEFYRSASRKLVSPVRAMNILRDLRRSLEVEPSTEGDAQAAMLLHQQTGFQFFDCLMIATAARVGCQRLFSEDMQHGRTVAGVQVINPFLLDESKLDRLLS